MRGTKMVISQKFRGKIGNSHVATGLCDRVSELVIVNIIYVVIGSKFMASFS